MEVKTESGLSITITAEGPSKVVFFNKPVRAVELTKGEVSQISALLTSSLETKINAKVQSCHSHPTKATKGNSH